MGWSGPSELLAGWLGRGAGWSMRTAWNATTTTTTTTTHGPSWSLPARLHLALPTLPALSTAELGMIFLPILCYWLASGFFFLLGVVGGKSVPHANSQPLPDTSAPPPPRRAQNKLSLTHVLVSVLLQQGLQAIVAFLLVCATRDADPAVMAAKLESWPVLLAKLVGAAFILDTYQVGSLTS